MKSGLDLEQDDKSFDGILAARNVDRIPHIQRLIPPKLAIIETSIRQDSGIMIRLRLHAKAVALTKSGRCKRMRANTSECWSTTSDRGNVLRQSDEY